MSGRDRPNVDELLAGLSVLDEHVRAAHSATTTTDRTQAVLAGVTHMRARRRAAARWAAGGVASILVGLVVAGGGMRANRPAGPVDDLMPGTTATRNGGTRDSASVVAGGAANVVASPNEPADPSALADATDADAADATAPGRIARPFALIELELVRHRLDELKARRPVIH
ncbi:MAG: hypothetical protein AB8G96_04040 [Phycisphaerales bacterium]